MECTIRFPALEPGAADSDGRILHSREPSADTELMNPDAGELLTIAGRAAIVYVAVLIGLRLMGKREIGQMTVFDLVVVLLLANAVQNAMVGPDTSVQGGLVAAFVLLVANRALAAARLHSVAWGRLIEGNPTVLIQEGRILDAAVRKERLERAQVEMAMREHGVASIADVQLAVLETDGSISIVPRDSKVIRTRKHVRQIRH
jgi:uncharacterized membrane protein YcaP (DUF421 family)